MGVDSGTVEYDAKNETSGPFCGVIRKLALQCVELGQSGIGASHIRGCKSVQLRAMISVKRSPMKRRIGYLKKL